MGPDRLRERRRRVPHDGDGQAEERRHRRAAEEGRALERRQARSPRSPQGDGNVAPIPGVLGPNQRMSMITKLAAGHYGILCFIAAARRRAARRARHGQGVRRERLEVVAHAADRRRRRRHAHRHGDHGAVDRYPGDGLVKITNNGTTSRDFNLAQLERHDDARRRPTPTSRVLQLGHCAGRHRPGDARRRRDPGVPRVGRPTSQLDSPKGRYVYASAEQRPRRRPQRDPRPSSRSSSRVKE